MNVKYFVSILFLLMLVVGCNSNPGDGLSTPDSNEHITKINNATPIDQTIANNAKQFLLEQKEVVSVRGVNTDKDLLLAIEVKQLQQFKEQDIEKEVKKKLEKKYPSKNIDVSSDQKIYIELDKLEKKIQDNKTNKKDLEKDFKKIKNLTKEQA